MPSGLVSQKGAHTTHTRIQTIQSVDAHTVYIEMCTHVQALTYRDAFEDKRDTHYRQYYLIFNTRYGKL